MPKSNTYNFVICTDYIVQTCQRIRHCTAIITNDITQCTKTKYKTLVVTHGQSSKLSKMVNAILGSVKIDARSPSHKLWCSKGVTNDQSAITCKTIPWHDFQFSGKHLKRTYFNSMYNYKATSFLVTRWISKKFLSCSWVNMVVYIFSSGSF